MNTFLKLGLSGLALVTALGVLPGVASAEETRRPVPHAVERGHQPRVGHPRELGRLRRDREWVRHHEGWCRDHRFACYGR